MNIDEMPAGTEMDRCVAEKVMGWDPSEWHQGQDCRRWKPSNDIAHAWEVVEKIRDRYAVSLHAGILPSGFTPYAAMVKGIKSYADTAPLAICRAVLKAVEA